MDTHKYEKAWNDKEYNKMFDLFEEDDTTLPKEKNKTDKKERDLESEE